MKAKQRIYGGESKQSERLIVTAIATFAILAMVVTSAKLLGEFDWHIVI
jgi:hypothetical protein